MRSVHLLPGLSIEGLSKLTGFQCLIRYFVDLASDLHEKRSEP